MINTPHEFLQGIDDRPMAIQSAEDYVAYFCRAFGVSLSDHDKGIFAAHLTARDDAIRAEERIALVVDVASVLEAKAQQNAEPSHAAGLREIAIMLRTGVRARASSSDSGDA